jgi:SAM-dependent methyltransferase
MTEWFEEWFGEEYLRVYPHRDDPEAEQAVSLITRAVPFQPGWRVLDVACGAGRHARAFEAAGARCTGVDLSATLLRAARQVTGAPLVRADMRQLPIRPGAMDLTVNLFTSFGYFEQDAEHTAALGEMISTVRPGGWFVIDFLNPEAVRRQLVPEETMALPGLTVQISRSVSPDGRYVCKTIRTPSGKRFRERVRLFDAAHMSSMLEQGGVTVRKQFGDYDAAPLSVQAPRTILIGQVG